MTILVTGGAGYIGSHVVRELLTRESDSQVAIVDDLSTGLVQRAAGLPIHEIDLSENTSINQLAQIFDDLDVTAVVHLAAKKRVDESVEHPNYYVKQNVGGLANLLAAMRTARVDRLVYSSSAAVYGAPDTDLITETTATQPINPYGETKLFGEQMIANESNAWGLRATALRYFNVAGTADKNLADAFALNLVPITLRRLREGKPAVIFGTDYPTRDGSCVRDYIHVEDLARAHVQSLDYLNDQKSPALERFNLGTAHGTTVRELFTSLQEVSGSDFEIQEVDRRPGDPAMLIADNNRARELLGWQPSKSLSEILESDWQAQQ